MADKTQAAVDFVMPVYNEGENIEHSLREIYTHVPIDKRVIVVYDFDEDNTLPVLRRIAPSYPGLETVKNTLGRGVLNAMRAGIAAAQSEVVIITMADLSDDMKVVPEMIQLINKDGFDVVCASRYMKGGQQIGGPFIKGLLSKTAGISLYWLAGLPTHDATNSFRAYRRNVLQDIDIESQGGFELAFELTVKAYAKGKKITEIPSIWRDRTAGQSRFKLMSWLPHYLRWYFYALTHRP